MREQNKNEEQQSIRAECNSDRIKEIYLSFLNSYQYDHIFKELDFDLSWLEGKLSTNDILRVEDMITQNNTLSCDTMFACGFRYAWELFHQCSQPEEEISNERIYTYFRKSNSPTPVLSNA